MGPVDRIDEFAGVIGGMVHKSLELVVVGILITDRVYDNYGAGQNTPFNDFK